MSESYRKVFFNGELVHESEAKISIYDSALMFGDMVFEMTRSFNKNSLNLKKTSKDDIRVRYYVFH